MFLHFAKSANLNRKINSALHSSTSNKLRKIEALFGILKTFLHTVNNVRSIDGAQNKENIRLLDTSIVHGGRAGLRGRWKVLRKLPYNNNITPYIKYTWYYYCAQPGPGGHHSQITLRTGDWDWDSQRIYTRETGLCIESAAWQQRNCRGINSQLDSLLEDWQQYGHLFSFI